jgi:hypothetical protein
MAEDIHQLWMLSFIYDTPSFVNTGFVSGHTCSYSQWLRLLWQGLVTRCYSSADAANSILLTRTVTSSIFAPRPNDTFELRFVFIYTLGFPRARVAQ